MSIYTTSRQFAALRSHSQEWAKALRELRAARKQVQDFQQNQAYALRHRAEESAKMNANIRASAEAAFAALHRQSDELLAAVRREHAQERKVDRAVMDSCWSRAKPLLDRQGAGQAAFATLAAESPEMRATLRAYLPLYLQTQGRDQQNIDGLLKSLSQAEQPHLEDWEQTIAKQEAELEQGLYGLTAAENWARHELETGQEQRALMGWDKGSMVDI